MQIQKDTVVKFRYSIRETGQQPVLEDNRDAIPITFLCGHENIMPALEVALMGKQAGDKLEVQVSAADAYGERDENARQKVPIKHLISTHKRLLPGTIVKVNTENGPIDASVIKAGKFMVELDLNHPFAGKDLDFELEVVDVREASAEELAHGHVHGEGGHHH